MSRRAAAGAAAPPRRPGEAARLAHRRAPPAPDPAGFSRYPTGPQLLDAVAQGAPARAVWTALPGEDWPTRLVELAQAALSGGRGALVVVPDGKDLDRLAAAAEALLPAGSVACCAPTPPRRSATARFLSAARGTAQVVLGTRGAVFAPVRDLGLVAIWDDGDDLHAEPRAPYPHARDVLVQRAHLASCAAVVAGTARTAEAALLIESGWAHELVADRAALRVPRRGWRRWAATSSWPATRPHGRPGCPRSAHAAARRSLEAGAPVLVQVPRSGYVPSLVCDRCRAPARCAHCAGPLGISPRRARAACGSRPAGGAPARRRPSTARTATAPSCAPPSSGRPGPPRSWPGVPRRRRAGVRAELRRAGHGVRRSGARRRHAGGRAGRRGRVRRGVAARLLGAARPGRPPGR